MPLPGVPPRLLHWLAAAAAEGPPGARLALVGGAVRDLLLHRQHQDPWLGVPDLDLVVEGGLRDGLPAAHRLARRLRQRLGADLVASCREHGAYGTVEIELQLPPPAGTWLLDVATARCEIYPRPAENPVVSYGSLDDDLARRDFTINAMALLLADGPSPQLLDPHGGQADLALRQLRFLHPRSLRDDPTRLLRAARYAARLGFDLAPCSLQQCRQTLAAWPWPWQPGDPPEQAPPALATRLRMELQLLLEREAWPAALAALQRWGGMVLLDPLLQSDQHWQRRLRWAARLGLPVIVALVAGAGDPLALADRLQLPQRQRRLLAGLDTLRQRLSAVDADGSTDGPTWSPARWTALLEAPELPAESVALALALGLQPRRPLLRWWLRWRQLRSPRSAAELIAAGASPGPALGETLRQLRARRLEQERP